jgi:uncharacterized membrane protein YbhN (UPF0104 family)
MATTMLDAASTTDESRVARAAVPGGLVVSGDPATAGRPVGVNVPSRRRRRRWLRVAFVVVVTVATLVALRGRVPSLAEITASAAGVPQRWLAAVVLAQAVSISMFACQQQRLLRAFGVPVGIGRLTAITYARSAMSITLPAGAAVSAGYAFRQFRAHGANRRTAMAVIVLSGVLSIGALVLLAAAGAAVNAGAGGSRPAALAAVLGVAATAVGVVVARHRRTRHRGGRAYPDAGRAAAVIARLRRRVPPVGSLLDEVKQATDSAVTMRWRDWLLATLFAAMNWLADLLCLVAATRAVGVSLPVLTLGGAYLAVQVVRQVPITPGGIGVIEASLLVALVTAGAAHAPAAAAVVIYRLVSCWAIVPVGLALWMALQTWGNAAENEPRPCADGDRAVPEARAMRTSQAASTRATVDAIESVHVESVHQ